MEIDWLFVVSTIVVICVYLGAGWFAQAKIGRTMSTSA